MTHRPATPRDAATVVPLRDGAPGVEVLMLRRHGKVEFAADAWVFPGGAVDDADRALDPACWDGIDPQTLAARFGDPPDLVLGSHVACVRETFEEAGLLLARHRDGRPAHPTTASARAIRARLGERREGASFGAWLRDEALVCDLGALAYHSRWITPAQAPKRYDTRFFLAAAPTGQRAVHDDVETTDQRWLTPTEALGRAAEGEMLVWYPTAHTLRSLVDEPSVESALARARAQGEVRVVQPHVEEGSGGRRIVHPDDPAYPHERYAPGGDLAETPVADGERG